MTPHSPLELLLPAGAARSAAVVGAGCPPPLQPGGQGTRDHDLVVVAPATGEWSSRGLSRAASHAIDELEEGGIVVVVAPLRTRLGVVRALRREGLRLVQTLLLFPNVADVARVVPARRAPLAWYAGRASRAPGWVRRLATTTAALPGAAAFAPNAVLVLAGESAPWARWLGTRDAVIERSPQTSNVVAFGFERAHEPAVVAKLHRVPPSGTGVDSARASASASGFAVPTTLRRLSIADYEGAVETALHGTTVARTLRSGSDRELRTYVEQVGTALERWSMLSHAGRLTPARLAQETVSRLETLEDALPLSGLRDRLLRLLDADPDGRSVAAHNDLTAWNVLVDDGRLGIVDWDEAEAAGLPLVDFAYAAVDAAASRDGDRVAAYERCFCKGALSTQVDRWIARLAAAASLSPEGAELCLDACWLRHAQNEHARAQHPAVFLEILARRARDAE